MDGENLVTIGNFSENKRKLDNTCHILLPKIQKTEEAVEAEDVENQECRICFGGAEEHPLVRACECAGSLQYVHEHCLVQWLERRLKKRSEDGNNTGSATECELCRREMAVSVTTKCQCNSKE
jgi:hypothetical protein